MKKTKGFTLVELMVVIVIIGILAALAIPKFLGATNKTKAAEFKPVLKQIYTLQTAYRQEKDKWQDSLSLIAFDQPDTGAARFTYSSAVSGGNVTNGILAKATVKDDKIKGTDNVYLTSSTGVACVDTLSKQTGTAAIASLSSVDANTNCVK